ncbi:bifunctional hydroxymethylpyrimidine kinase/phosphomethylpyrimidine kinase [Mucilaginibacter sp. PPCGB 2223]|uniref:bifunctional hydroxymethylpyrimidine kinase/phosphomethylpyrimidine kinase n=1 Tax=Mucilaginibacter sp. PPCGB 2223 TaxID=1886027 RepID=UPI000826D10D|nr:bifunctional hydroxymethylpyrimidine kinase/phosphomethylpyrimidine kinase [Mucilaginibacter sp. PPCGB 2223]OCX50425.1 bifunctional hydroxymethylpyrimidine kinase/phosphomethylpyrimidine kinase [Mucilaginibacter sp. PPCGB 2223]
MQYYQYCSILTIAGSDSGGGAGIQADLKTFAALGCYGTSAITAITAQNTLGVTGIHIVPPVMIQNQIRAVMDDIRPAVVKIGMLPDEETVKTVADTLKSYQAVPIILDPVISSGSGKQLANNEALLAMKELLFPMVTLLTPNLNETAQLIGKQASNADDMKKAAETLLNLGSHAVLVKGGHLTGAELYNVYADQQGERKTLAYPFVATSNTHGTGCTLASAIAACMARGQSLIEAIDAAGEYVNIAIKEGRNVKTGEGYGPLNHFFRPRKQAKINPDLT